MSIGKKIRTIRRSKDITQNQLCEIAGTKYNQKMLSLIEKGERKVTVEEAKDFAKALDVDILDIIE